MSEYIDLSPTITGPDTDSDATDYDGSGIWVIVKQDEIPADQQQVTEEEAKSMLEAALSGYSAFRGLSSCPVRKRSLGPGNHIAKYTATILIHKSNLLDDYDLTITKDGVPLAHSTPVRTYRRKSESFDINYNQTVQLGFQPFSGFVSAWNEQFGVLDTKSNRLSILDRPTIDQYDGFLTLKGNLAFGIIKASALAIMDRVTVDIEHKLGSEWGSTVLAEVRWPAGSDPEYQDSAECEVLLPECVKGVFDECAATDSDGNVLPGIQVPDTPGDGDGSYIGDNFSVGPNGPTKVFWNICTREVIEVTNDNRDSL